MPRPTQPDRFEKSCAPDCCIREQVVQLPSSESANMLFDSEGYAARAEECRRLADVTDDIPLRAQFLSLHRGFLEYARHLEKRERAVSEPDCERQEMA